MVAIHVVVVIVIVNIIVVVVWVRRCGGCPGRRRRQRGLYGALVGESRSPAGEERFVTGEFGDVSCRVAGDGEGRGAELGVLGGMVEGVPLRELGAEVLNLLLGQFEGAQGLLVLFLLAGERLCAFCAP